MSYLGPVRVDPIDRLKTIFPEDVSGNITWTCLANLAAFAVLNDYLLGSTRGCVGWIERTRRCPTSLRYRFLP